MHIRCTSIVGNYTLLPITNTVSDAAAAVQVDGEHGESPSGRDDDGGRVGVEDSAARRVAQMLVTICSTAAEPVDSCGGGGVGASFSSTCVADSAVSRSSESSLSSPPANAACGLVDPADDCFSSQTMPSNDTDILSTIGAAADPPQAAARLEHADEEADNAASSLSTGTGSFRRRRRVDVETSGASDDSADETRRLCPAGVSSLSLIHI